MKEVILIEAMYLKYFIKDNSFPFFIHYGGHDEEGMFIHNHEDFSELVIVIDGSALHIVDSDTYPISKGDVFVINKNTSHGYIKPDNFKICNIMFRLDDIFNSDNDITKSEGFHALFIIEPNLTKEHCYQSRLKLSIREFEYVLNILELMVNEFDNNRSGRKTMLVSLFMNLLVTLSRNYELPNTDLISNISAINIAKSVSFIENHFSEKITIKQLADISFMSKRHFARVFYDNYKTTPSAYINNVRMLHSTQLLKNTLQPIGEIAWLCGFSDPNFFIRKFKKINGITPGEYRKNIDIIDIRKKGNVAN